MEPKDLMINDWIILCNSKGERIEYTKVDVNLLQILDNNADEWGVVKFSPILITKEIIEKNHLEGYEDTDGNCIFKISEGRTFCFESFKTPCVMMYFCTFVHELQHALRLCGFGELADNIIV